MCRRCAGDVLEMCRRCAGDLWVGSAAALCAPAPACHPSSYVPGVSLTDQIDRLAFRYLAPPMMLLVVGYAGYCLVYSYFKGWYSWILECLVALVYGGGFIVMTPQLFINYRLKSVACLPWKFFMYKARHAHSHSHSHRHRHRHSHSHRHRH